MDELRLVPVGWVPEACTLPTAERPVRRAEFDNLFTTVPNAHVGVLDALVARADSIPAGQ
jgi:hypothetical protein